MDRPFLDVEAVETVEGTHDFVCDMDFTASIDGFGRECESTWPKPVWADPASARQLMSVFVDAMPTMVASSIELAVSFGWCSRALVGRCLSCAQGGPGYHDTDNNGTTLNAPRLGG